MGHVDVVHVSAFAIRIERGRKMGKTSISWTDFSFNPWWGCTRVSPGCVNCYAETFDKRVGGDHWGPGKPRRTFGEKHWREPLKWKGKVFCASMADIFDEEAPEQERRRLWDLIRNTPDLTWQLLSKRVNGYLEMLPADLMTDPRIWKGFTAEDQDRYDERWDVMRRLSGITWCSYEPAIGPLTTNKVMYKPHWFVFGGESGNGRRPCERKWADSLLAECRAHDIAFFMKQMSARTPDEGKHLIPDDLAIQEFPASRLTE
jgi:protein gp37